MFEKVESRLYSIIRTLAPLYEGFAMICGLIVGLIMF